MPAVKEIPRSSTEPYILDIHYAGRMPSISHAFGLFDDDDLLCGVCTFGTPPSAPLRSGICGPEWKSYVVELNRLCLRHNRPNEASFLVSKAIKMLQGDYIIVSFADCAEGHTGVVYQATNFLYCGLSAKRTDWKIRGREHLHGQTIADEFRGCKNRAELMRQKYGDDFYLAPRSRKHRYITFRGSKGFRKKARASLRYPVIPYPKEGAK